MLLGAHVSIAGGYLNALEEAKELDMDAIQIFTKNQRFWKERAVTEEEGKLFKSSMKKFGVKKAFSHAIYLVSLGSENPEIVEKSVSSLIEEMKRCKALGLSHACVHPGSAGKLKMDKAIQKIGDEIKKVIDATKGSTVKLLIENTAGGGSSIGGRMENVADLIDYINSPRVGLCLDTCHAFAAGYDIRPKGSMEEFLNLIDKRIGIKKLNCFHINDSKGGLGSRIDRHAHIGEGLLGLHPFEFIMKNFSHVPKVVETDKENNGRVNDMAILRKLAEND